MFLIYLNFTVAQCEREERKHFYGEFSFAHFMIHEWKDSGKIMTADSKLRNIFHKVYFRAYPNQIVELAEPVVQQFIWVVGTL